MHGIRGWPFLLHAAAAASEDSRAPCAVCERASTAVSLRFCIAAATQHRCCHLFHTLPPPPPPTPTPNTTAAPTPAAAADNHLRRRRVVAASFLGVGAPEAILVAVVALVVFGPKGLADAAKSVGSALRAFQPTIKEVVEVSQDLRGTLERELGLDEIREAARVPPPSSSSSGLRARGGLSDGERRGRGEGSGVGLGGD